MDFNALGTGQPFYVLQKSEKPVLQVGVVKSKSEPKSPYQTNQPAIFNGLATMQGQNLVVDMVVTINGADVPFSNLIQIDCQGSQYVLQRSFLLEAKRQYTLTVKISKKAGVFDIGIAGWDIIDEDFGGTIGGERKK